MALRRALGSTFAANALDFLARPVPTEAWLTLAARTQALTAGRRAADGDRRCAGAPRAHAWPVELPLVGDDHATTLRDLLATDVDAVADGARRTTGVACWPRWSARAGCASTPPPRPD